MRTLVRGLLTLVLVGTTITPLGAQEIRRFDRGHERHGFFLGLGGGAGSARIECDLCSDKTEQGGAGWFTIGGTVGQHLRLAADLNGWTQDDKGTRTSLMTGTFRRSSIPGRRGTSSSRRGWATRTRSSTTTTSTSWPRARDSAAWRGSGMTFGSAIP